MPVPSQDSLLSTKDLVSIGYELVSHDLAPDPSFKTSFTHPPNTYLVSNHTLSTSLGLELRVNKIYKYLAFQTLTVKLAIAGFQELTAYFSGI